MARRQSGLQQRLAVVQAAVQQLPGVAAAAAEQLLDQDQQQQRAPDGTPWRPTKQGAAKAGAKWDEGAQRYRLRGRFATGAKFGAFDPSNHIRYTVAVRGAKVVLETDHPAAPFTRWGTRHMVSRAKVPGKGGGAAWWPRILKALRGWHGSAP